MATGDSGDMQRRLEALLPARWWSQTAIYKQAVVGGISDILAWLYSFVLYAGQQTRIGTATNFWLDIIAYDYFGLNLKRRAQEGDDAFRRRILNEILRERVTRPALQKAVQDLTGNTVEIFEPANPQDTGGWGIMFAFGEAGAWGSQTLPYQLLIDVVEPTGAGIPSMSGLTDSYGGWGAGAFALADPSLISGAVTNQDIYDTINRTRAAGITVWTNIAATLNPHYELGVNFVLGSSTL